MQPENSRIPDTETPVPASWWRRNWGIAAACLLAGFGLGLSFALPKWASGELGFPLMAAGSLAAAIMPVAALGVVVAIMRKAGSRRGVHTKSGFSRSGAFAIVAFALIFLSFLFSLLSVYPGYCSNDSMDVIRQATGEFKHTDYFRYDGLTNHHPILYTMLVRLVFALAASATIEVKVFCFLLVQAALFAAGCAWALRWMNKNGAGKVYLLLVLILLAALPVYAVHAVTMWKDALFAAAVTMLALQAYEVAASDSPRVGQVAGLGVLLLLVAFLRNNGVFIDVALLVWMLVTVPEARKQLAVAGVCFLAAFLLVQGPLFTQMGVEKSRFSESLGVPLQQLALATVEDEVTDEQLEFLDQILPHENVVQDYQGFSSNKLKFDPAFDDAFLEANKMEFFSVWAQVVAAHPATALRAWVNLTSGLWKPGVYAEVGTKNSVAGQTPQDLLGLGWNPRGVYDKLQKRAPYVFGKGSVIWLGIWLSLLALALRPARRLRFCAPFIPLLALLATMLIASPSGWDYRYVFPFLVMLPFVPYFIGASLRSVPRRKTGVSADGMMR